MPGDNMRQRADAHLAIVGRAPALPCLFVQMLKEEDSRTPHVLELFGKLAERISIEGSIDDIAVLLVTGQRRFVVAGETQRPVSEDSFRVDKTPLPGYEQDG